MGEEGFYTLKGYQRAAGDAMSSAMEDYLEMITRLSRRESGVKVSELSRLLHVKPSSVTKMVAQLAQAGYVSGEKYGDIHLTRAGLEEGNYLMYRHDTVLNFLLALNGSGDELEQAEKIEHFLNKTTIENLHELTKRLLDGEIR